MKELRTSETRVVRRSQLKAHPLNPKSHTDEEIRLQLKNFKKNGYLGGIIWNERDGTILSGHRRVAATDLYYKYDGTPETDYDIKVEVVDYDEKTALEQMTFLSGVNDGKPDYNKIAAYIHDISTDDLGLSDSDIEQIKMLSDDIEEIGGMDDITDSFLTGRPEPEPGPQQPLTELKKDEKTSEEIVREHREKPKMTREEVKDAKAHCDDVQNERQEEQDLYAFITFADMEQKAIFCELIGREPRNSMQIMADEILALL